MILIGISVVWTFFPLLFRNASIGDFLGELIRFVMFFGFYYWLLEKGPDIALKIINYTISIGTEALGKGATVVTPSQLIEIGYKTIGVVTSKIGVLDILTNPAELLASLRVYLRINILKLIFFIFFFSIFF